jgi:hypothetical protein
LAPRALRAEVGSTTRLLGGVFGSPAFSARSGVGFNLGAFLQRRGKLILERGDLGEDASRAIMGAIVLQVIAFAKSRRGALPLIRIYIDEATNARLFGSPELRALAETRKNGLFFHIMVQNLDFPGGADAVLQNCVRHEWYRCSSHDLARKAATDVIAGLLASADTSRAERLNQITQEIMNLPPGVRWVRDQRGSRKERVTMLEDAWPDWPGLRNRKLAEKLAAIRARPEYGVPAAPPSPSSSPATPLRPTSSPSGSSAAARWQRAGARPAAGSKSSDDEAESASWEPS